MADSNNTPATEQRVVTGNFDTIKRELTKLLADGWRVVHLAGGIHQHATAKYVAVVERPRQHAQPS